LPRRLVARPKPVALHPLLALHLLLNPRLRLPLLVPPLVVRLLPLPVPLIKPLEHKLFIN
jgi:hypothetical protein